MISIVLHENNLEHLKGLSDYNSNYYKLPIEINRCNVLFEKYDGADQLSHLSIGVVDGNGSYWPKYYLNEYPNNGEFHFHSDSLSTENKYL